MTALRSDRPREEERGLGLVMKEAAERGVGTLRKFKC